MKNEIKIIVQPFYIGTEKFEDIYMPIILKRIESKLKQESKPKEKNVRSCIASTNLTSF